MKKHNCNFSGDFYNLRNITFMHLVFITRNSFKFSLLSTMSLTNQENEEALDWSMEQFRDWGEYDRRDRL